METCGSSACMANVQWVQTEKWSKVHVNLINKEKKNEMKRKEKLLCGSLQVGKRNVDSFPAEGASGETAQPFPPPSTQPFTSGSYRAIEHSPSTSTSPTSATKSILKQHSPQFPHYFTCQTLTKHLWMAKYSYGAPQHTSCQPRPY